MYKESAGSAPCLLCPKDHYSPAHSSSSSDCYLAPKIVFALVIRGDMSASRVTQEVQDAILDSIARSLNVQSELFRVNSVSDAGTQRRLDILTVNIEVEATVSNSSVAQAMAARTSDVASAATAGARSVGFNVTVQAMSTIKFAPLKSPSNDIPASSPQPSSSPAEVVVDVLMDHSSGIESTSSQTALIIGGSLAGTFLSL